MGNFIFDNTTQDFFEADTTGNIKKDSIDFYRKLSEFSVQNPHNTKNSCIRINKGYNFYDDSDDTRFKEDEVIILHKGERCLTNKMSLSLCHNPFVKDNKDNVLFNCLSLFSLYGITNVLDTIELEFMSNKFHEVSLDLSMLECINNLAIYLQFEMPSSSKSHDRVINIKLPKNINYLTINYNAYSYKEVLDERVKINLSNNKFVDSFKINNLKYDEHIIPMLSTFKTIKNLNIVGEKEKFEESKDNCVVKNVFALEDFANIKGLSTLMLDVDKVDLSGITKFKSLKHLGLQIQHFYYRHPDIKDIDWFEKNKKPSLFLNIGGLLYNYDDWKDFATAYNKQKSNA